MEPLYPKYNATHLVPSLECSSRVTNSDDAVLDQELSLVQYILTCNYCVQIKGVSDREHLKYLNNLI